jgi:hypothetical protein
LTFPLLAREPLRASSNLVMLTKMKEPFSFLISDKCYTYHLYDTLILNNHCIKGVIIFKFHNFGETDCINENCFLSHEHKKKLLS